MPTIAAIHGACLGGGCEMVLACDYRLCSDGSETRIGLPETKLGIIPGFGGCVRLPRTVGLQASLDIILAGKAVDSRKAAKIGLVDEAVPFQLLESRALAFAHDVAGKGKRQKHYAPKGVMNKFLEFADRPPGCIQPGKKRSSEKHERLLSGSFGSDQSHLPHVRAR